MLDDLSSGEGVPFTHDDIFKGRRLWDTTWSLFCEVAEYNTNQRGALPKSTEFAPQMLSIRGKYHTNINVIVNLVSTMVAGLWPGYKYPPPTPDGIAWHAAQILPKMMGRMHKSPTRTSFCKHLKLGATIDKISQDMIMKLSLQRVAQVTPGKGRWKGAKKYTNCHVTMLLDCVEDILPCGKMIRDNLSLACIGIDPEFLRNGESYKIKFHKMAFAKNPTGQVGILIQIWCAKSIKRKIDAEEVIIMVGGNNVQ